MSWLDRIGRSIFVGLAVGLGWGIRGDFGHLVGAMYPGASLALALAYVSGQRSLFLWMPILSAVSALTIGSGGSMSYGILHGYAQADTLANYSYGFVTLFLQGSAWGTFGGAMIGLLLERRAMRTQDWLGLIGSVLAAGWLISFLVVNVLGFDINPPRNNGSIAFMGGALGQLAWLIYNRRLVGLRGALLGYFGFGLGMAGGRLLGNIANELQPQLNFTINHWNVMETSCGFIGGFVYAWGMVHRAYPEPQVERNFNVASVLSILYVLGLIPLWHRLSRIRPEEKLKQWAEQFQAFGYTEPEAMADTVLWLLNGVCLLGFIGAGLWMVIHFRRWQQLAAVPVLWLSLTMVLFQNLNALYFFTPARPRLLNMHSVFWVLLGLMALYAALVRPRPAVEPAETEGECPRLPISYALGAVGGVLALGLVILAAGAVNGEETMKSANTRWPAWTWKDGPFPPREQPGP